MTDTVSDCGVECDLNMECEYCNENIATNFIQCGVALEFDDCEVSECCQRRVCEQCLHKTTGVCWGCHMINCTICLGEACAGCFGTFCSDCRKKCPKCSTTLCYGEFIKGGKECWGCKVDSATRKQRRIVSYKQRQFD